MDVHPLRLTRSILDPVHGLIRLTDEELKVISSPIFQRLRRIKQNGLLSYVFPAATHTRFEHSVGVLFVVESMLQALVANSIVANDKKELGTGSFAAVDIVAYRHQLGFLFRTARLAALCHDLGHGPFSHAFDKFAPRRENVAALLDAHAGEVNKRMAEAIRSDTEKRIPHEWMSCVLFSRLFRDLGAAADDDTPLVVAAAIHDSPHLAPDPSTRALIPLIHDLIASAPADADRMDYVERDSRSCGVTYGLFDRDRVLKSFLCYADEAGTPRLGIKSSGFRAIENFVQARFQLFVQVYYHKTNRAIELMLQSIGKIAEERDLSVMREDSLDSLIQDYTAIGDDQFLDMLVGGESIKVPDIQALASRIAKRQLWKRIEDFREARIIDPGQHGEFLQKLQRMGPANPDELFSDSVQPKATKDLADGARPLFRDADGVYRCGNRDWLNISPLISALEQEERLVVRIYYTGDNLDAAKKCRLNALKLEAAHRNGESHDGKH